VKRNEKRKKNYKSLIFLYLSFILNKKTIIAIIISLLFLTGSLVFISNIENETDYLISPLSFHQSYFNLSILIMEILNGILIAFFVLNLSINSLSFDTLFVSYVKRTKLALIKLIVVILLLFILLIIEFGIIMLIALLRFSLFKLTKELAITFLYNYIAMIFEALASIALTEIFSMMITPLFVLFSFLIIRILMNNFKKISDSFINYFPYTIYNSKNNLFEFGNLLIIIVMILFLTIIYIEIYSIKDFK